MSKKDQLIKELRRLPDEILENLYSLDIITLKGKMQHNLWLSDRYRKYRVLSLNEDWLAFEVGNWRILMEAQD